MAMAVGHCVSIQIELSIQRPIVQLGRRVQPIGLIGSPKPPEGTALAPRIWTRNAFDMVTRITFDATVQDGHG